MEGRKLLDSIGPASGRPITLRALALCLLLCLPVSLQAQDSHSATEIVSLAEQLHAEKRWEELTWLAQDSPALPPEVDYLSGLALARLTRWDEAGEAFERGRRKAPGDKRFSIEFAGVAFKQKKYRKAKSALRRALRLDPYDAYANDFLATLYILEGNTAAAVKYWNRIGKPQIEEVVLEPEPNVDAVMLDRAFTFAPAEVLRLGDLYSTEARLDLLGIFHRYRFDIEPAQEDQYNLVLRSWEKNGKGRSALGMLLPALRGLPYQTVFPELINLNGSAMNFHSMLRWDTEKRRLFASFSGPLMGEPKWRYELHMDARNENWNLRNDFNGSTTPTGNLNMRTIEAGLAIKSRPSGRWGWTSSILVKDRKFRYQGIANEWTSQFLTDGIALKYRAGLDYQLLRIPERRLTTRTGLRWEAGKIMQPSFRAFSKLEGSIETHWLPEARREDFEVTTRFRAGKTMGQPPFDELFQLGYERDNDLWLRGHVGTHEGRKGSAPLGRDYLLINSSIDKVVYAGPAFSVRAGPFLDSGKIYDPSGSLGSKKWLWDTGIQLSVRVLESFGVVFTFGKDLRSGRNTSYATAR